MKYLWDFFGPHAERTAQHFLEHLRQFQVEHALELPTGLESAGEGHWAAFCVAPAPEPVIEGALRPNRRLAGDGSAPG